MLDMWIWKVVALPTGAGKSATSQLTHNATLNAIVGLAALRFFCERRVELLVASAKARKKETRQFLDAAGELLALVGWSQRRAVSVAGARAKSAECYGGTPGLRSREVNIVNDWHGRRRTPILKNASPPPYV